MPEFQLILSHYCPILKKAPCNICIHSHQRGYKQIVPVAGTVWRITNPIAEKIKKYISAIQHRTLMVPGCLKAISATQKCR